MLINKETLIKRISAYLVCAILIISGYYYSNTLQFDTEKNHEKMAKGKILEMVEMEIAPEMQNQFLVEQQWQVKVEVLTGLYKGRVMETIHYYGGNPAYDFMVHPEDEVILSIEDEDYVLSDVHIADIVRDKYIYYLLTIFLVCILLIGAKKGLKTIISLLITGLAVLKILLPGILAGKDPIFMTILICTGVTIITLMLITGFSKKSLSAIVGTVIGIVSSGLLAKHIIHLTRITGLGSEESRIFFFSFVEGKLDMTGILFAGIVIGALGAVMDVAISIASSITEIHLANPKMSVGQLIRSGLNIGRDIIGTMSNTLILAYTGSSLPLMLLLLANEVPYLKYINLDMIATEIIRALSGSIGLFLAVPFTAIVSAILCKR